MLVYKGGAALSAFRTKTLLQELQAAEKGITEVSAEYLHFVDAEQLEADLKKQLQGLLTYGTAYKGSRRGILLLVVPRPGTISPWSSKATDIVHNAGLDQVRRVERGVAYYIDGKFEPQTIAHLLHDRMTEAVLYKESQAEALFATTKPKPFTTINIKSQGKIALAIANTKLGLALSQDEIDYLYTTYTDIKRNPTDVELMMFAQVNSEHCRHKIFNATWEIDGETQEKSLFKKIKNTYELGGQHVLSAYSDNAAVLRGPVGKRFFADTKAGTYGYHEEPIHLVAKVETHNHPTAIAPAQGAATGSGGEIRDEGATGRGAKPKMGLTGFTVSNLRLPDLPQPWETACQAPDRIASPLQIMIDAPLGGAAFNNEFGRPNLAGYFRTYEQTEAGETWGYHKPIMIAGGLGNIRDTDVIKKQLKPDSLVIVLGGPAMLIGLGGGAASSMQSGQSDSDLDFASVQRANAEIQRRCQEVINACWAFGKHNPIVSIHDVGAGGLSNALPELVHDSGLGALFELRDVPNAEPGMSPLEIWCNEAQERYVMGIAEADLKRFTALCVRERCPFAVVGITTKDEQLIVKDRQFKNEPVNVPMSLLFGKASQTTRSFVRTENPLQSLDISKIEIDEAVKRVLHVPAVGSKKFLITIGDRSVGGLTVRDQMVGPWQVPVSDVAVTASGYHGKTGEAMAMGERTPIAVANAAASARMAVGEAIMNIAAAPIKELSEVALSANWMAAASYGLEGQHLYDAVTAVGEEFCPALGVTIPVGKDSLSMRTVWRDNDKDHSVISPLSLIVTAFAPVTDITQVLSPLLRRQEATSLLYIDLGDGKQRLGGSALAQAFGQVGAEVPDVDPAILKKFWSTLQSLQKKGAVLAYHDRSDGGLFTTLLEMAFASRMGLDSNLSGIPGTPLSLLFSEELGAVIQVDNAAVAAAVQELEAALGQHVYVIGRPTFTQDVVFRVNAKEIYRNSRAQLETWWAETSYHVQTLRDNPQAAAQEHALLADDADPGISPQFSFSVEAKKYATRPKAAILREQGVNGQVEMAAAFDAAGFTAVDVHMSDLLSGRVNLADFKVLAACGGFSYGDVLGAGSGWAKTILNNPKLRTMFQEFFARKDTLTLGVCNGCQMLAGLKELIPGAENWPELQRNTSEQFEARLASVQVVDSPSIFLKDMTGAILPIPVAHGEGRMVFANNAKTPIGLQYVDNYGKVTENYPLNPNGSTDGITAVTTADGRATMMMPHPERAFLTYQYSWHPDEWGTYGPWFKIFQNARDWIS